MRPSSPFSRPSHLDPGRPFPHISNLGLNLAVKLSDPSGRERFARVKVPDSLPQLVPSAGQRKGASTLPKRLQLVWLER